MDYLSNDEHDEDDLPVVTLPNYTSNFTTKISNDNNEQNITDNTNRSSRLVENWRSLYETSLNSLQSDDEDQTLYTQKASFYIDQPPTIEKPLSGRPYSPIYQPQLDSNTAKSKWEIRLPQLLNSTVGPDRQKRDMTRRYTTNIVFQLSNSKHAEFNPYSSSEIDNNEQPISPIVKQLKQKFDRIIASNTLNQSIRSRKQFSTTAPKLQRVASLTCRGLNANTSERLIQRSHPALPIRQTPESTTIRQRSASSESLNNPVRMTNGRPYKERTGPPVSYPKHFYPPPSTTSVVKQLLGNGATLVYDSISQHSTSKTKSSIIKHKRSIEQTREDLKDANLTGRQLSSDSFHGYATIDNRKRNNTKESIKPQEDESITIQENESNKIQDYELDENYYEPIRSRQTSNNSMERKSNQGHTEPSVPQISTSEPEHENYYPVYDSAEWRNDDDDDDEN